MRLRNPLHDRKTDSRTGCSAIRTRAPVKTLKDLISLCERNERPFVANADQYLCLLFLNIDGNRRTWSTVFGRIIEKLKECHLQKLPICPHRTMLHPHSNVDSVLAELLRRRFYAALDELSEINLFPLELEVG